MSGLLARFRRRPPVDHAQSFDDQVRTALASDWPRVVVPERGDPEATWVALAPLRPQWEWALIVGAAGGVSRWANGSWVPVRPGSVLLWAPEGRLYDLSPVDVERCS